MQTTKSNSSAARETGQTIEYRVDQEWGTFVLRRWVGDGGFPENVRRSTDPRGEEFAKASALEMMRQLID